MENKKIESLTETVNKYLSENGEWRGITSDELLNNREKLDDVTDAIISLICKIGVDENFAPNIHGIVLDGCLEALNEIREEISK